MQKNKQKMNKVTNILLTLQIGILYFRVKLST